MTMPTDPMQPHSNTPPQQPLDPLKNPSPAEPAASASSKPLDPTGVWARFLGGSGQPASPADVEKFIQGVLMALNFVIKQETEAAQKASEKLKKALEGKDE